MGPARDRRDRLGLLILQLNPPLPVFTPRGKALAHFVIDYGIEAHLCWVCALHSDGAIWTFQNPDVRMEFNQTIGRKAPS
jgi:hypothetical protein